MSGKSYPRPTYLPPLSIFNPIFFPQVFPTTSSSSGGGGGGTNNFPSGILSGNTISYYATDGTDRNLYGVSVLEFSDSTTIDYTDITTTMELTNGTFTIQNTNTSSVINLVADSVQANGVAIGVGTGNVSNDISNNFLNGTTQTFSGAVVVDNTQTNIGQFNSGSSVGFTTSIGLNSYQSTAGSSITTFGYNNLNGLTTPSNVTAIGNNNTTTNGSSNIILIGGNQSSSTGLDIKLGSNPYNYVKFFDTGNGYGLSTLTGNSTSQDPNFSLVSGNALLSNAQGVNIIYSQATQIQGVYGSGAAGKLQIYSGSNGGGSLQLQDSSTNPPTNTGFGNFASVNGLPFYYSPTTISWSQLATTTNIFQITSIPVQINTSDYTWGITIPNSYGNTFLFSYVVNVSPTSYDTTINSTITLNGAFGNGTGIATIQPYTINGSGSYSAYVPTLISYNGITTMTFFASAPSSGTQTQYTFSCSNSGLSIPLGTTISLFGTIVS